tara:strand:- start:111 stop:878 length:768 start_codon:yes stop_codon:yes gene_type:complete
MSRVFSGLIQVLKNANDSIHIKLNNPPVNALSSQLIDELYNALMDINSNNQYKFLEITGLNKHFSAGADLKERACMSNEETIDFVGKLNDCFDLIENLKIPTIAAVQGATLGGGAELALCCDVILIDQDSSFDDIKVGFPETTIGIIPGGGGTYRINKKMSASLAKYWILSGKIFSYKEAVKDGFIDIECFEKGVDYKLCLSNNSRASLVAAKESMNQCYLEIDRKKQRLIELEEYKKTLDSPERREALKKYGKK